MVNPGLDEIKRSNFQYDFDYEHKIAREYGIDDSHDSENPSAHNSSASSRDLPSLQVRFPMAGWVMQITGTVLCSESNFGHHAMLLHLPYQECTLA